VARVMTRYAALKYRDGALAPIGVAGAPSFVGREHKESGTVSCACASMR
jgi:hypothetical protein